MVPITSTASMPQFPTATQVVGAGQNDDSGAFKSLLLDSIKNVNDMQLDADKAVEALFTGEDVNPAEVLTAVQKADLAFRLTMQIRNKAMEVYREVRDIRI